MGDIASTLESHPPPTPPCSPSWIQTKQEGRSATAPMRPTPSAWGSGGGGGNPGPAIRVVQSPPPGQGSATGHRHPPPPAPGRPSSWPPCAHPGPSSVGNKETESGDAVGSLGLWPEEAGGQSWGAGAGWGVRRAGDPRQGLRSHGLSRSRQRAAAFGMKCAASDHLATESTVTSAARGRPPLLRHHIRSGSRFPPGL